MLAPIAEHAREYAPRKCLVPRRRRQSRSATRSAAPAANPALLSVLKELSRSKKCEGGLRTGFEEFVFTAVLISSRCLGQHSARGARIPKQRILVSCPADNLLNRRNDSLMKSWLIGARRFCHCERSEATFAVGAQFIAPGRKGVMNHAPTMRLFRPPDQGPGFSQ